jgi:hypothetical protein
MVFSRLVMLSLILKTNLTLTSEAKRALDISPKHYLIAFSSMTVDLENFCKAVVIFLPKSPKTI